MATSSQEQNITIANSLSDHCAQVDPVAKAVSQNLQGPYAIKPAKHGWAFDLPTFINPNSPDYNSLSKMTGLSPQQCQQLVSFMIQNPSMDKKAMSKALQSLGISGIGDVLGQGGFRISIETDAAYKRRMHIQITALIGSVAGDAEVLNFQEQPYQGIDEKRMRLFSSIMNSLGYTQARGLKGRDVGIWVKKTRERDFTAPAKAAHLIKMVENAPFRGCILQDKDYLYLNLHLDRYDDISELVDKLIALKNQAETYAQHHKPALSLIIQGDMNLFKLNQTQQQRLRDADFVVEPVKGQEKFVEQGTPTCEAYLRASPKPVAALSPIAAASAFHSYPQSSSAPLPYAPQYQQPAFASQQPPLLKPQQPNLNSMSLEAKREWLQSIFTGGFTITADSDRENHYYIVHKDKAILESLSQTLFTQCGIAGREGNLKFVKTARDGSHSYIILVDENLPLLFESGLSFDATAFASTQSSSIAGSFAPSSYSPSSSSSAPPPLASQHHSVSPSLLAPASPNSPPYMTVSSRSDKSSIKIAPFKYEDAAYFGPFANTTRVGHSEEEYRVPQTVKIDKKTYVFNWPSSEHAYHAQKIIHLKETTYEESESQGVLDAMLGAIENSNHKFTGEDYEALVNEYIPKLTDDALINYLGYDDRLKIAGKVIENKAEFDALCNADFNARHNPNGKKGTFDYMRMVIALKAQQHPELAEHAMACAREGIFPVEVSKHDYTWAAGPDGTGMNMLGIIWLEIGNKLLIARGETPAISDPENYYNTHLRGLKPLSDHALAAHTKHPENWPKAHSGTTTHSASASLIDVAPFKHYEAQRAQKGEGFTFFGGFEKKEKLAAVQVLIAAIGHCNTNHGSMPGFNRQLSPRQLGALCEGELGIAVAKIGQQALTIILSAIIPWDLDSFSTEELKKQLGVDIDKIDGKIKEAILTAIDIRRPIAVNFNSFK